jgi:hypothetical protein
MTKAWNPTFQFLTVTKTLILVLPTDVGIGENKGCRWKEIRFEASQRARLAHNMTPSERDLLCTWAKLLHQVEYCDQIESSEAVPKVVERVE